MITGGSIENSLNQKWLILSSWDMVSWINKQWIISDHNKPIIMIRIFINSIRNERCLSSMSQKLTLKIIILACLSLVLRKSSWVSIFNLKISSTHSKGNIHHFTWNSLFYFFHKLFLQLFIPSFDLQFDIRQNSR